MNSTITPEEEAESFQLFDIYNPALRLTTKSYAKFISESDVIVRYTELPALGGYRHLRFGTKITDGYEEKSEPHWIPVTDLGIRDLQRALNTFIPNSKADQPYTIRPYPYKK